MEKTLVIITSYNRKDSLLKLHEAILAGSDANIAIFDDKSDWPVNSLQHPKCVDVIINPEHRGKSRFWQTYNDIFAYCKEHEYDYYIILPDDVEPCPDFVSKAIEAYDQAGCICLSPLLTNRSLLPGISRWGRKPIECKPWGYLTHYFDCAGIMKRDFFEALGWQLDLIAPNPNPLRSSGVGRQVTLRLQALGKAMGHVRRTLLTICETDSKMNTQERLKHPMYADWRDNETCVDVHMAALWRGGHVVKTAESLLQNPELATLFITLNAFTPQQFKETKDAIKVLSERYGKNVVIRKGTNKKGSNEKLSQLPKSTAKYIAFADDDIVYPENHLMRLIAGCNVHNAAVSLHGAVLRRWPIKKYYNGDREMKSWNIGLDADTRVDIIGTGVCLLKREWLTADELKDLYTSAPEVSMDDIIVSCLLSRKSIPRYVLEHLSGAITLKPNDPSDAYVYDRYKNDDAAQVEYINENYQRYK